MDNDETNQTEQNEAIEEYKPELTAPGNEGSRYEPSDETSTPPSDGYVPTSTSPSDYFTRLLAWANENHTLVIVGLSLLVVGEMLWGYSVISNTKKQIAQRAAAKIVAQAQATAPTFSIQVTPSEISVGEVASVSAMLDTKTTKSDGATVKITYDPKLLQYVEAKNGSLYRDYTKPVVDAKRGAITISGYDGAASTFQGAGVFVTLNFKALKAGSTKLDYIFHKDNPDATALAAKGKQVLESVTGTALTIK